ncbi:O-methyltransferase [Tunturiibacter lichenicola]|uniref:O-methyltransferase n=1 Tax=Tunturiibacter lichenicola TaxID=2051959 RepID=UPI0021B2F313|nr:class I SAM-dependent methyltransferase [Edaphobacter lichenicola]
MRESALRPHVAAMKEKPPPKTRTYGVDSRHFLPMLRDLFSLATVHVANSKTRRHVIQLGRSIRQHAFDARDPLPVIDHPALASFLGCDQSNEIVLPPIDTISLSGLGFAIPYTLLATIASALRPKKIFETGTFRGVGTITLALNAPEAQIFTLDLPEKYTEAEVETLSKGDKEWVRLSRTSTGFAFQGHPAAARIHQLRGNSLTFEPPPELHNVDLCFIDGGHSYECIKADTQTALKILAPNGVIVWDDYSWFAEGVGQYLTELRQSLPLHRIAGSQLVLYRRNQDQTPPTS